MAATSISFWWCPPRPPWRESAHNKMWISSWLTMIFWKETSLLSFSNAFFWAAFRTESRAPSISIIFKRRQTSLKQSRRINSNTRTRRSIYFVFTRRWTVPLRLLSLADKLLTAITQACPISCGMQKQIGRRWYHREAVCLSSSLSGCSPGSQKRRPSSNLHKHFLSVNRNTVILRKNYPDAVCIPSDTHFTQSSWRWSAFRLHRQSSGQRFARLLV